MKVRIFDFCEPQTEYKLPRGWEPFHAERVDGFVRIWAMQKKS